MLVGLLQELGLLGRDLDIDFVMPLPIPVAAAVHAFVSATPSLLTLVQADDLAGETVAVNLPGTDRDRPNWRRRIDADIAKLCHTPVARAVLGTMQQRAAPGA
jgi:glycogen operon protein